MKITNCTSDNIEETRDLLCSVIDELHKNDAAEIRAAYKSSYSLDNIKTMVKNKDSISLCIKEDDKVIGFIFGWHFFGIGNIHWMGISKEFRGKKISDKLMNAAFKEFEKHNCYKIDVFTYPHLIGYYKKYGFKEVSNIENLFSINLSYMVKQLRKPSVNEATKRIRMIGSGGQGIKLLAYVLSNILSQLNYHVTLNLDYDAAVQGGDISADLVFSDYKISSPVIEEADILLQLTQKNGDIIAKRTISEQGISSELVSSEIQFPFKKIASEEFKTPLVINMLALGILLRQIGINIEKVNLNKELPSKFLDTNLNAIRYGFSYRDTLS